MQHQENNLFIIRDMVHSITVTRYHQFTPLTDMKASFMDQMPQNSLAASALTQLMPMLLLAQQIILSSSNNSIVLSFGSRPINVSEFCALSTLTPLSTWQMESTMTRARSCCVSAGLGCLRGLTKSSEYAFLLRVCLLWVVVQSNIFEGIFIWLRMFSNRNFSRSLRRS